MRHVVAAAIGLLVLAAPAVAQTPSDIIVGGVWAFKITQPAGGMTADDRVVEVQKRITDVLSRYRSGQNIPVRLQPMGTDVAVAVGEILVVTVNAADATGTSVTTLELARQWAGRLHQGLVKALPDATFHVF